MRLISLQLENWRNLATVQINSNNRFVILHGKNAQGKTNILESVYTLATLRSFRESRSSRLIQHDHKKTTIRGVVDGDAGKRQLEWSYGENGRKLVLDGRPLTELRNWFAPIRAILFCPEHGTIVRGRPQIRRQFVDRARFTAHPAFLELARSYARTVRQKSSLLRQRTASNSELDAWDARLVKLGSRLAAHRLEMIDELQEPFQQMHQMIAGQETVRLRMRGLGPDPDALAQAIHKVRSEECRRGQVLVGPHRDDLVIELNGRSARMYASQGQVRSIVLALKLAELEAARKRGASPLFLLDDLSSELDSRRMHRLVELLSGMENQVWITTTDPKHLGPLPQKQSVFCEVSNGSLKAGES